MAYNTTNNELFLVELAAPYQRLPIQFVPDDIITPRQAYIHQVNIVGRNNDLLRYSGGNDTFRLNLDFLSDEENRQDVISKVAWLKSLAMNDGNRRGIRNVKMVMGDLFRYEVWIVRRVTPKMTHFDNNNGWLPLRAKVTLDMVLDPARNLLISDVRR